MKTSLAFLCDAANVTGENKLNVLGVFSTIASKRFPVTFPSLSLVLRLESDLEEAGDHSIAVRLIDSDGQDVLARMDVPVRLEKAGEDLMSITTMAMVTFPRAGDYSFEVSTAERRLASVPLKVVADKAK